MINFYKLLVSKKLACVALVSAFLATGCDERSQYETTETIELMDTIEMRVKIPPEGRSLDEYVRYYTYKSNGDVSVVFITPHTKTAEVLCGGEDANPVCTPENKIIWSAEAGTRMWLKDFSLIPGMDDGGCDYIQFEFVTDTQEVSNFRCNALN